MTADDQATTLADQAASWVPPWARRPEPSPAEPVPADAGPAPSGEPVPVAEPEAPEGPEATAAPEELADQSGPAEAAPEAASELVVDAATDAATETETPVEAEAAEEAEASDPEAVTEAATGPAEDAAGPAESAEAVSADDEPAASFENAEPIELRGPLEAILLVVDEPVTEVVLAQVLEQPTERIVATLTELAAEYTEQGRGFELRKVAGGWRLYTRGEYAAYVERFVLDGQQVRLTQAALETLAVVAYKQPVTRSRISAIRGVNCDGVIRTLVTRGLVEECGSEPDSGAFLYRTTALFLEKLGLDSIDELPPLAPFLPDDVEEIANAQG